MRTCTTSSPAFRYSIILTEPRRVCSTTYGDLSFRNAGLPARARSSSRWSEEERGTNGYGTCLFEAAPLSHSPGISTSLAPTPGSVLCGAEIRLPGRRLVLPCWMPSGESEPDHITYTEHARARQHAAQMIENDCSSTAYANAFRVALSSRPELVRNLGAKASSRWMLPGPSAALDATALFQLRVQERQRARRRARRSKRVSTSPLTALIGRTRRNRSTLCRSTETAARWPVLAVAQGAPVQTTAGTGRQQRVAPAEERLAPEAGRSVSMSWISATGDGAQHPGGENAWNRVTFDSAARRIRNRQGILARTLHSASERVILTEVRLSILDIADS